MAATNMKADGNVALVPDRTTVTTPSSTGWRRSSRTFLRNSGSSSRNSTPWWARLTSPGRGTSPPPMSPASVTV